MARSGDYTEDDLLDPFHQVVARTAQANPLLFSGTGWGPLGNVGRQQPDVGPDPNAPNPLVLPPVPVQEMPIAQQVAWHTMVAKESADATALQGNLLEVKNRKDTLERVAKAQDDFEKIRLRARTEADPSKDDYPLVKNRIILDHSYGTLDPRFKDAFADTDLIYQKRQDLQRENQQHERNLTDTRQTEQIQAARTMAQNAGPQYAAQFESMVANDPAGAIALATDAAGKSRLMNTVADLKALGYTDEQIQAKFQPQGQNFLFEPAEREIKTLSKLRDTADVNEKRDMDMYGSLLNQKNAVLKAEGSNILLQDQVNNWKAGKAIEAQLADPKITPQQKDALNTQLEALKLKGMTPSEWDDSKEAVLQYYQHVATLHGIRAVAEAEAEAKKRGYTLPATVPVSNPQTVPATTPGPTPQATPQPTPGTTAQQPANVATAQPSWWQGVYGNPWVKAASLATNPVNAVTDVGFRIAADQRARASAPAAQKQAPVIVNREQLSKYPDQTVVRNPVDGSRWILIGGELKPYGGK